MSKRMYRPPQARDLGGFTASRGLHGPTGWCTPTGHSPGIVTCSGGNTPTEDPSYCRTGLYPEQAGCATGLNVLLLCLPFGSQVAPG
jgi:hypothetical protein